jgi:hypothetical protein
MHVSDMSALSNVQLEAPLAISHVFVRFMLG